MAEITIVIFLGEVKPLVAVVCGHAVHLCICDRRYLEASNTIWIVVTLSTAAQSLHAIMNGAYAAIDHLTVGTGEPDRSKLDTAPRATSFAVGGIKLACVDGGHDICVSAIVSATDRFASKRVERALVDPARRVRHLGV